jgi:hypothetical protein
MSFVLANPWASYASPYTFATGALPVASFSYGAWPGAFAPRVFASPALASPVFGAPFGLGGLGGCGCV